MRGKLLFITGGLVGYVLGARAGRKRYDQIAAAASDLWNAQPVQRRVTEVRDFALEAVGDAPGSLFKAGKKVVKAMQGAATKGGEEHPAARSWGARSWGQRPPASRPPAPRSTPAPANAAGAASKPAPATSAAKSAPESTPAKSTPAKSAAAKSAAKSEPAKSEPAKSAAAPDSTDDTE